MTSKNMPRLRQKYEKEIVAALSKELGVKNKLALPRLLKVVVNMGVGDSVKNKEALSKAKDDLAAMTGQYPSVRPAKKSVASFSIREGMPVGLSVTLRGNKMYYFLDKLFTIVLPRLRDFRGLPEKSFDGFGNYTLGIADHTVFPEIDLANSQSRGLEVSIVTSTKNKKDAKKLLSLIGMPFEKKE